MTRVPGAAARPLVEATDPVVEATCAELRARSAVGIRKYGVTLARGDLSEAQWRRHLFEELADALLYAKRLMMMDEGRDA